MKIDGVTPLLFFFFFYLKKKEKEIYAILAIWHPSDSYKRRSTPR